MIDWIVSHLSGGHTQPARDTLPVNNGVDFGREPASEVTETMISSPLCRRSLLVRPDGRAVDPLVSPSCTAVMASIIRSLTPAFGHNTKRWYQVF